jgi:predicted lipid-binding transport protein (Tim44 family)
VLVGAFGREGTGPALLPQSLLGGAIFVFVMLLRRHRLERPRPGGGAVAVPAQVVEPPAPATTGDPGGDSILDAGIQDIRRMDARFDPTRFTGYVEMVFRATQNARAKGDVEAVRDRVTPELYGELRAQAERLSVLGQARRVDQIDVRAEVTEAWHEEGRDYVTAYIAGSMRDDTVDASTGALVDGPETGPKSVDAFYTFTRPAGLHPWMLSAIQTSDGMPALPS